MDVLYSIRPEWCNLILDGFKSYEVRKELPRALFKKNGVGPFVGHIYCTKGDRALIRHGYCYDLHRYKYVDMYREQGCELLNGKIIASFECWNIAPINEWYLRQDVYDRLHYNETCIPLADLKKYMNGGRAYALQMSNLVFYSEPLSLADFGLKKAPQSWCYVERSARCAQMCNL